MPGKCELAQHIIGEIAPVQDIKPAERDATGPDLLHPRLVFLPPGIREGRPVEVMPERPEDPFGLAGNPRPPVDQGPKHIEENGSHGGHSAAYALKAKSLKNDGSDGSLTF